VAEPALERKIVSVVFCDLEGFTALSEGLDAEDVVTVQDAYFAAVDETVGRYGGRLEKYIGDAAVAVFGVPRLRDDDAERAVRAGLALAAAVDHLNARLGLDETVLRLRVGVNTGEVVQTEGGPERGPVTGDTVNVPLRGRASCRPRPTCVSHPWVGENPRSTRSTRTHACRHSKTGERYRAGTQPRRRSS
jgi:class 3 adenylate cyclase